MSKLMLSNSPYQCHQGRCLCELTILAILQVQKFSQIDFDNINCFSSLTQFIARWQKFTEVFASFSLSCRIK